MEIIPGILEKEWESIEEKLNIVKTFAPSVHIDIIDGKFVNNLTFLDPEPFKKYSQELFLELHMMVEDPARLVEPFAKAGFKRFLGHIEHMPSQKEFVEEAARYGEVGLALDGPTHISAVKVPFDQLNSILVYTSHQVGFAGPPLMQERLDKIKHLRKLTELPIEADGGVNDKSIVSAKEAGATRFVSTSYITGSENPSERFKSLQNLITL